MREIHIAAGLLALLAGFLALSATKGSDLHRAAGRVFVAAMLLMTGVAAISAGWLRPDRVNTAAALLTMYLVLTATLTVKRRAAEVRPLIAGLALWGLAVGTYAFTLAAEALASPRGLVDGIPAQPLIMFGVLGTLGAGLDARLALAGDITGKHRLARHLWRMVFALWIATASFFLGQFQWLPEPVRKLEFAAIPVLGVLLALAWFLWRTLRTRRVVPA